MFWQPHWRVILMLFGLYPTTLQDNICYLLQATEQWNYGLQLPKRNLSSGHLKTTQRPQHCQRQWIGLEMIWLIWWLLIPMLIVSFMILKRAILSLNWKQLRYGSFEGKKLQKNIGIFRFSKKNFYPNLTTLKVKIKLVNRRTENYLHVLHLFDTKSPTILGFLSCGLFFFSIISHRNFF